jgi:hypothetical protein
VRLRKPRPKNGPSKGAKKAKNNSSKPGHNSGFSIWKIDEEPDKVFIDYRNIPLRSEYWSPKTEQDKIRLDRTKRAERKFLKALENCPNIVNCGARPQDTSPEVLDVWNYKNRRIINNACFVILPYLYGRFSSDKEKVRVILLYNYYFHLNNLIRLLMNKKSMDYHRTMLRKSIDLYSSGCLDLQYEYIWEPTHFDNI